MNQNLYCIYFQFKIFNLIHLVGLAIGFDVVRKSRSECEFTSRAFANRHHIAMREEVMKPEKWLIVCLMFGSCIGSVCFTACRSVYLHVSSVVSGASECKRRANWISWKSNYFIFESFFCSPCLTDIFSLAYSGFHDQLCCDRCSLLRRSQCCGDFSVSLSLISQRHRKMLVFFVLLKAHWIIVVLQIYGAA